MRSNKAYLGMPDLFEVYANPYNLHNHEFTFIVRTFCSVLGKSSVDEGKIYNLPKGLGIFGVRKKQTWGRGVFDYQLYKTEGVKVWKKNLHSDRYTAIISWDTRKPRCTIKELSYMFKFKPCRDLARYLAKQIKYNNTINKYYDY